MSELYNLNRLHEDQIEAASHVLARAFQDDPLFVYLYSNPLERKTKCITYCEWIILNGILYGEVYTTSSNIEGIAVWLGYFIKDHKIEKQSKESKKRLRKVKRETFSESLFIERCDIFTEVINSFQDEHANIPHWELTIIGVDPIHQGKGYGSKLLRMKLAEVDEQNLPCYLHTENERNIKLYEHFGFKIVSHAIIPNSELNSWAMIRNNKNKG